MKAKLINKDSSRAYKMLEMVLIVTFIKRCKQYQIPGKAAFLLQTHTTSRKESG